MTSQVYHPCVNRELVWLRMSIYLFGNPESPKEWMLMEEIQEHIGGGCNMCLIVFRMYRRSHYQAAYAQEGQRPS